MDAASMEDEEALKENVRIWRRRTRSPSSENPWLHNLMNETASLVSRLPYRYCRLLLSCVGGFGDGDGDGDGDISRDDGDDGMIVGGL